MDAALRKFYARTKTDAAVIDLPYDEIERAEHDDPSLEEPGEYEFAQRRCGIKGLFRYLLAEGYHPLKIMKRLFAVGRGMRIEPFAEMTYEEAAMMFGETKAAHSWRMKVLSGMIKMNGMQGTKLPGQKSEAASKRYAKAQMGNTNRADGTKRKKPIFKPKTTSKKP